MAKNSIFFSLFLLFSSFSFAEEPTFTYIVYSTMFPSGYKDFNNLGYKYKTHEVPLKWGNLISCVNTNYMILTVTPKDNLEKTELKNKESSGSIKKIMQKELKTDKNGKAYIEHVNFDSFPTDLNKNWSEIWRSTP